jgi:ArsR family transcriptional regulator, nickel/cobalt-responsive transcriptional repressor
MLKEETPSRRTDSPPYGVRKRVMSEPLQPDLCARALRALADPERLRIVRSLLGGGRHVSELAELLDAEVVNISHHLGVLRHAGLVRTERQGRYIVYHLHPDVFPGPSANQAVQHLDLGCCRLELPKNEDETT